MGVWPQKTLILLFGIGFSLILWGSGADLAVQLWLADHYDQGFNNIFRWLGWLGLGRTQVILTLSVWIIMVLKRCGSGTKLAQTCRKEGLFAALMSLGRRTNVWLMTLPVFAVAGVLSIALKLVVGRPRPKEMLFNHMPYGELHPIWQSGHFKASLMSWPSGHSASTFAIGTLLLLAYPEHKKLILTVMVVLAASRFLALTPHYLGDVVAGATVGTVVALAMAPWFGLAHRKSKQK
jgi:membrane-associated phospholipid phosphatase